MLQFLTRIFGSRNQRLLKGYSQQVREANALEPAMQALTDEQLRGKTDELRQRLAAGTSLEQLIPEAFAAVREASRRTLGLRHFDVQLIGGIALHEGKIAEMRTGEGKTLVATLAAYLNALPGKGVHVVTVNEYLAQRDAEIGPGTRMCRLALEERAIEADGVLKIARAVTRHSLGEGFATVLGHPISPRRHRRQARRGARVIAWQVS